MQAIDHSEVFKSTYRKKNKTKQTPLTIAPTTNRTKTKHRRSSSSSWKAGKLHNSQQQGEQGKANAKARRAEGGKKKFHASKRKSVRRPATGQ